MLIKGVSWRIRISECSVNHIQLYSGETIFNMILTIPEGENHLVKIIVQFFSGEIQSIQKQLFINPGGFELFDIASLLLINTINVLIKPNLKEQKNTNSDYLLLDSLQKFWPISIWTYSFYGKFINRTFWLCLKILFQTRSMKTLRESICIYRFFSWHLVQKLQLPKGQEYLKYKDPRNNWVGTRLRFCCIIFAKIYVFQIFLTFRKL